jgi:hypothetical protein
MQTFFMQWILLVASGTDKFFTLNKLTAQVQGFRLTQHWFDGNPEPEYIYIYIFPPEDGHKTETCSGY